MDLHTEEVSPGVASLSSCLATCVGVCVCVHVGRLEATPCVNNRMSARRKGRVGVTEAPKGSFWMFWGFYFFYFLLSRNEY